MKYRIGHYLTQKNKFARSLVARFPGHSPANAIRVCDDYQVVKNEIRNRTVADTGKQRCRIHNRAVFRARLG